MTAADVQEMLNLQRDTKLDAPLKLATKDEELEDHYFEPGEVFARENRLLLRELIGTDGTVHFSAAADTEHEDEITFSGVHLDATGWRKIAAGGILEMVVLQLSGGPRMKVCKKCGVNKPLDEFCERRDLPTVMNTAAKCANGCE